LLPAGVFNEMKLNYVVCEACITPDDGRKHRPKHVELTKKNKLTYVVASCWLLS